ncbi:MAG TPA: hypothetical protein VFD67_01460 [Gemmatimonadaceae bacterium]|nr:hypothetical protein [Gemmatimonadaceae bacterium]
MSRPRSNHRLTMIVFAGTMLLAGCLSKAITNEQAAGLIRGSATFARPKFAHIPRQLTFQNYYSSAYGTEGILSISDLSRVDPTVAILKLARVVNVSESIYGPGRGAMHLLVITPTGIDSAALLADEDARAHEFDQQENLDAQEERPPVGYSGWNTVRRDIGWRVAMGTREFLHVDRIHNWKDANENIPVNELAVDFSWRWVPNEFGDCFDTQSTTFQSFPDSVQEQARYWGIRMNTTGPMHSRAFLYRDGDQWKLRLIQWSVGMGNPR